MCYAEYPGSTYEINLVKIGTLLLNFVNLIFSSVPSVPEASLVVSLVAQALPK